MYVCVCVYVCEQVNWYVIDDVLFAYSVGTYNNKKGGTQCSACPDGHICK